MNLCRVVGTLWSTIQSPHFDGHKLLLLMPLDPTTGALGGDTILAIDTVQAGIGDTVLVIYEGSSTRQILADEKNPCEALVVAVVDRVDLDWFPNGRLPEEKTDRWLVRHFAGESSVTLYPSTWRPPLVELARTERLADVSARSGRK